MISQPSFFDGASGQDVRYLEPDQILDLVDQYERVRDRLTPEEDQQFRHLLSRRPAPAIPLNEFIRASWRVVEPNTPYMHNWHIDAIALHLEAVTAGLIKNLIINIQPRHMKSLLVSVFWPSWVWTFDPSSKWLFLSHNRSLSVRDNLKRRRIITSSWYQETFGHVFQLAGDQKQKLWFENDKRGHMIAQGLSGTGLGADYIVGDDILSREHAYSPVRRDTVNAVWDETVSTRLNDPRTGKKIMIAQRLHADDPVGHALSLESSGGEHYEQLIIPTEYEGDKGKTCIGWKDPRTIPGSLLWPERYTPEFIERLKISLGSMGAAAQLQQRPSVAAGSIFNVKWWKFYHPPGNPLPPVSLKMSDGKYFRVTPEELPGSLTMMQSWDASFKDASTSSYVVGQVWGKADANMYLLDQIRDKMNFPDTIRAVERMKADYPMTQRISIEDKANGPAVIATLKSKIPGIVPTSPSGSKESRANAIVPFIEAGNVYLPHPVICPWVFEFIEELQNFPVFAYNDQVDATSQAIIQMTSVPTYKKKFKVI